MTDFHRLRIVLMDASRVPYQPRAVPAALGEELARRSHDFDVDVIDLADDALPETRCRDAPDARLPDVVAALAPRLEVADGFIVMTATVDRYCPPVLCNVIDWFHDEWSTKPVGLVVRGSVPGRPSSLGPVRERFAAVQAITLRETLTFGAVTHGTCRRAAVQAAPGAAPRALREFLTRLALLARAMRDTRRRRPLTPDIHRYTAHVEEQHNDRG